MRKTMTIVTGALGFIAIVGAGSMLMPERAQALVAAAVQVVNTAANPVPVSGSVDANVVGGNVNATLSGPVTLAPGSTVHVDNGAGAPFYVHVIDDKQPARGFAGCFFTGAKCQIDLYTVPSGYRLVIEHVSANIGVTTGQHVTQTIVGRAYLDCCILSNDDYPVPHLMDGTSSYQVNDQTLMYFDPGDTVRVMVFKDSSSGGGTSNFSFAGHLVPAS